MAFRGERFVVDLSSDDEDGPDSLQDSAAPPVFDLIGEVKERAPSTVNPPKAPAPPQLSSASTGFPEHRKRNRPSAFKQQRAGESTAAQQPPAPPRSNDKSTTKTETMEQEEKRMIDEENKRRLASMSPGEVEQERSELMSGMPTSLLERFLRRANIDDDQEQKQSPAPASEDTATQNTQNDSLEASSSKKSTKPTKSVSFDIPQPSVSEESEEPPQIPEPSESSTQPQPQPTLSPSNDDLPPRHPPADLRPASELPNGPIHFPTPPPNGQSTMPNLDPSSPSFLSDLQTHYFPNTSHDPSTLSWFQQPPIDPSSDPSEDPENPLPPPSTSPYTPNSTSTSLPPSALRFTLTGHLLSPRTALSLPTTLGLHHHGSDPQAAGYTIPELAILSRSTYPAQRCIAWQVLGRVMFRLGKGEFGERGSGLVDGLWDVIEGEKVVAGMLKEGNGGGSSASTSSSSSAAKKGDVDAGGNNAGGVGRHASAKAWALEGIWLWRLGGGGDRGLVKEGVLRSS